MSVTGADEVRKNLKAFIDKAKSEFTEKSVTEMLIIGAANAHMMTPVDTSVLIDSQGRQAQKTATGYTGYVFYGAFYAEYVHKASGKLKGKPRAGVESFTAYKGTQKERVAFASNTGNFWDTGGEPKFLEKGMVEMAESGIAILKKHYGV